jgi:3-(methylthio)propanoyl-CoA dehydrogenase
MSDYQAPLKDMLYVLDVVRQQTGLDQHPELSEFDPAFVSAVLEEAGKFARGVLSPLNAVGDVQGCSFNEGSVTTPDGWKEAYQQFNDGGWMGLAMPADFGGQQLPKFIAQPVNEMWLSSNLAFVMFHALNQGCSEILSHFGTDDQKARYMEAIVSGRWSVAMALTEPGAGSDLAATTTKAVPVGDGTYRIKGQKIFITYGEHDMAENIVHLVLARTPDAPAGSRGISLFAVPKIRINADGSLAASNDVRCTGIEHKMGLHGSPTCSMSYGDHDDCIGELLGEENKGLMAMFVLMNEARLSTGMQGVGFGEMAYQHSLRYATERTQGSHYSTGQRVAIVEHPDIQRMLLTMHSQTMGLRAVGYLIAVLIDLSEHCQDKAEQKQLRDRIALLTPIFKAYSTEQGNQMATSCVQVYGGMGFVEETGVAQFMRDARIITIYEGTTGIQARDLVFRKIMGDQGVALNALLADIRSSAEQISQLDQPLLAVMAAQLGNACSVVDTRLSALLQAGEDQQLRLHAGSVPLLDALGTLVCSWQLAVMAAYASQQVKADNDPDYHNNQIAMAQFFFAHRLPALFALLETLACADAGLKQYQFVD